MKYINDILCFIFGAIFIYASYDKILHPDLFANIIYNYQVLPTSLINLVAIVLPCLEFIIGLLIILKIWMPGALFLSNMFLVIFIILILFNIYRGIDINCGCFSTSVGLQENSHMVLTLLRDFLILCLGMYLFVNKVIRSRT